jgi:hypothetical protein
VRLATSEPHREIAATDWSAIKASIVAGLDLTIEFEAVGVRWAGQEDSNGWRCREPLRPCGPVASRSHVDRRNQDVCRAGRYRPAEDQQEN